MTRLSPTSAAAAFAVAALVLALSAPPAYAMATATGRSVTQLATSGHWGAVATAQTSAPFGTGPYAMSFASKKLLTSFFSVGNSGSVSLTGATLAVAASPNSPTVTVEECTTTWNETKNTCTKPGSIVTVVSTLSTPASIATGSFSSGSSFRLRATVTDTKATTYPVTVTIGVSISRSDVVAATTTNG